MKGSFKNRIAFQYLLVTAGVVALAFGLVYIIVRGQVYNNLDTDLAFEAEKHTHEIRLVGDSIVFANKAEWMEREHREVQVNPVFVQLIDKTGRLMDKSPNLKGQLLEPRRLTPLGTHYHAELNTRPIRQVQIPISVKGVTQGYILAAMPSEGARDVLRGLARVLLISFPIILIGLYLVSRYLAGRSIGPVNDITATTRRISKYNLNERVRLPAQRDELYDLSHEINLLLDRIGQTIDRERQFTSDASHELRTPLTALRGTLEILIRSPRSEEEYRSQITAALAEIDRMSNIVDQLLQLARFDAAGTAAPEKEPIAVVLADSLAKFQPQARLKQMEIALQFQGLEEAGVLQPHAGLIFDNLISNAIKYGKPGTRITAELSQVSQGLNCDITDQGIGIRPEDLDLIFQPFFRSEPLAHKHIPGNGLGLSIVRKAAEAIGAEIQVSSEMGQGTTFSVIFK